ncbi:phosphoenolpyruvate carboxykinase (ATP), partial [bacterium]|nr:phosphoenolpyruvate carboxykinase (ATP) [bacterium]
RMLGEKMDTHGATVYLVNTGWTGGPYGVGHRISLPLTRTIVNAALDGKLEDVEYECDPIFKISVPKTCPGIDDPSILKPVNTWEDAAAYEERAQKLAADFAESYEKSYGDKGIDAAVAAECPGA